MGSSNSTAIQHYVNNDTEISSAISSSIEVDSSTATANYQVNSTTVNVGTVGSCCKGLSGNDLTICVKNMTVPGSTSAEMDCNLDITQSGNIQIKVSKTVTVSSNATLISNVMNQLQSQIEDTVRQNNDSGVLSGIFGESNDENISTKITNSLRDDMSVKLSQKIQSQLRSTSGQDNKSNINLCSGVLKGSQCNVNQDFSFNLYSVNVLGAVANITSQNEDVQKLVQNSKSFSKQTNTNWLSDIINDMGLAEQIIIFGILAVVILCIIFGMVALLRKHKSGSVPYAYTAYQPLTYTSMYN